METALSKKQIQELVDAAKKARHHAYAPYSRFTVGAALLALDGKIYVGCNVENISYGLTQCAERSAVCNAVAHGCRDYQALAIVADTDDVPPTPCGACRQVLAEFNPTLTIICANTTDNMKVLSLDELLPHHFDFGMH